MPERLADRPCLIHCHKRHIVYRTERHCNTNTNTPRVGDTLGKPLVCGSSVGLKVNIAMSSVLQLVLKSVLHCLSLLNILLISHFPVPFFSLVLKDLSRGSALVT